MRVVVAEAPLRDGNRVVLRTNSPVVVQPGNAGSNRGLRGSRSSRRAACDIRWENSREGKVELWRLMPESELAFAWQDVDPGQVFAN
jgi:hypothetical protein